MTKPSEAQYQKFKENFKVIEAVTNITNRYELDIDNSIETFTNLSVADSTPMDIITEYAITQYSIVHRHSNKHVRVVYDTEDILDFMLEL